MVLMDWPNTRPDGMNIRIAAALCNSHARTEKGPMATSREKGPSSGPPIVVRAGERPMSLPAGTRLFQLRQQNCPSADITILNGFPTGEDAELQDGDCVVFIERGAIPDREELQALMMARHTPGVHQVLKDAVVGIAGLGGLGSAVAVALARVGVGHLVLADFDVVEPSNLNRQQYFVDQIGEWKTGALRENLLRVNPYLDITTHRVLLTPANVPTVFRPVQVLVEAVDRADAKAMLAESFKAAHPQTPLVMASGLAGYAPGNAVRTRALPGGLVVVGDEHSEACPGTGLMAPRVGIAAHHQANAVLRLLLGETP